MQGATAAGSQECAAGPTVASMDEPTIPMGEPELWRVSAFRRAMDSGGAQLSSRYSALSPSLLADLQRFEANGSGSFGSQW